jgi:DNA modification methylase
MKPSDLGYDDDGFILPPLNIYTHFITAEYQPQDKLMFTHLGGVKDRNRARASTVDGRLLKLQELVTGDDQWIIWTGLQAESTAVTQAFPDSVEVKGDDSPEYKAQAFEDFQDGKYRLLVTKGKIGAFGLNMQNAHKMAFFGLNDSWELYYQAIRREWRYRQEYPVDVHIIMSDIEAEVYQNVMRKDAMAKRLREKLIEQIRTFEEIELERREAVTEDYAEMTVKEKNWTAMMGDSCKRLGEISDNFVDLSVYSPPFADLFTYSDSERDLGNSKGWDQFFEHYAFIIREVLRVTRSGRLTCVHTSDIPAMASRDGYIGVRDFPGEVIRAYEKEGWTFVGRAFVQKNPQAQAIRVKSKALLFVQMRKDSASSRPALVDQILLFRKPGENAVPITPVDNGEMDNEKWIEWAHGIWLGISETDTLQYAPARGVGDEKHICPLQLGTIERCIKLYSNPGETVLTPFGGIGSEA